VLQQFLRLRAAAEMQDGGAKGLIAALRAQLSSGLGVDVAGYRIAAALASGLAGASLEPPASATRVAWLEISNRGDDSPSPASAGVIDRWKQAGHSVDVKVVPGPTFWQTAEIEDAPVLIQATLALLGPRPRLPKYG
jgi:uncharacterized protein